MNRLAIQSWALIVDAYRELNSKKLFWITIALSGLVVAAFAMFGLNKKGLTFLWFEFPLPLFNSDIFTPALFYKFVFSQIGIAIWLSWVATVLALISTASIIPDFVASGSIELTLSKPIGRLRLFLSKFATGLLFVALQVSVFTGACFLVIGLRGGEWEWGLWLAVPIVLLFFSYLFAICALVGLLTRSTIASLLITLLCWFAFFVINTTDNIFVLNRESAAVRVEDSVKTIEKRTVAAEKALANAKATGTPYPVAQDGEDQLEAINPLLKFARLQGKDAKESLETWQTWSRVSYRIKAVLPKTTETIQLLSRRLISLDELEKLGLIAPESTAGSDDSETDIGNDPAPQRRRGRGPDGDSRVGRRHAVEMRSRSTAWVIGTSLAFELLILSIASVIFVRRDF